MKVRKLWVWISLLMLTLMATACLRSIPVQLYAFPTLSAQQDEDTTNPGQNQISATQTANAIPSIIQPTATVEQTAPSLPEASITPVEIVTTVTPGVPESTPSGIALPTLARPNTYTIQSGENPWCIADRFNVDYGELLSINRLTTESLPLPGTILDIPNTGHPWSSGERALLPHPSSFTIRIGDTLGGIACLYGDVSPEAIIVFNQLSQPDMLTPGELLLIP